MSGCYLLYSSQGKSGNKKEEKEIERSDGSGCLVRGQQNLQKKKESQVSQYKPLSQLLQA